MTGHTIPTNREDFERAFVLNTKVEGLGFDVTQILACPFCAAPDFQTVRIITAHGDLAKPALCEVCGRAGRMIVVAHGTGTDAEFVQTGGDDPPEWMRPWPRRVEDAPPSREAVSAAFAQLEANEQASAELDEVEDPQDDA